MAVDRSSWKQWWAGGPASDETCPCPHRLRRPASSRQGPHPRQQQLHLAWMEVDEEGGGTMGSRLGALIRTGDGWETYYDHWAAQTVGIDIALEGLAATLERVCRMQPMGLDDPHDWQGATWIEGTLLIDQPRRVVVWAEESEMSYAPRLINLMIEQTWPGWTAIWSPEGTRGVLCACGVDPSTIFIPDDDDAKLWADAPDLYPWEEWHGSDPITVRLSADHVVTWRACAFLDELAHLGPARFREIAMDVQARRPTEAQSWLETQETDCPTGGVYVDFCKQQVRWWCMGDRDLHIPVFELLWPGWSVVCSGDDYGWHAELIGEELRTQEGDVDEFTAEALCAISEEKRVNHVLGISGALAIHGESVTPVPATSIFEPSQRTRSPQDLRALIGRIAAQSIGPARIITAGGDVIPPLDQSLR